MSWAANLEIYFTRSRPYAKNDQATIEFKNNHVVHRYTFYYRYDTDAQRELLNYLWAEVNTLMNYLAPTRKPVGWGTDRSGRRQRLYDTPATPLDRLLATDALTDTTRPSSSPHRDSLNPAAIMRHIHEPQGRLTTLANPTDDLYLTQIPPPPYPTSTKTSTPRHRPPRPPQQTPTTAQPAHTTRAKQLRHRRRSHGQLDMRHSAGSSQLRM